MKILNVAEKNDAAKNIANILSRGSAQRREGMSKYNKIYEFSYSHPDLGNNIDMLFTSVSGHLLHQDFPISHRNWQKRSPAELFDAPVETMCAKESTDVKNNILNLVKYAQMLIIWTDCDREGENIGFEIINTCLEVKPYLKVKRARFSEITSRAVNHALSNLVDPDKLSSDAVEVRKELDLRIGAAFTRFQTLFLQKRFPVLQSTIVSYGSCQFPTLGFVVQRFKQQNEFLSNPFWFLEAKHSKDNIDVVFKWERVRLFDKDACVALLGKALVNGGEATVTSVEAKPKNKWRPTPMDTIQMEKLASMKLKISAKETMKIAEKLYSQGYISYPRTETNIFPPDLKLKNCVEAQQESNDWGNFARKLLEEGLTPRQGKKSDKAHPPIHPIKFVMPQNLQPNERRVYELIVRHFLACLSQDALGKETTVTVDIGGDSYKATGLFIYERNYLDVYPYEKWNAKEIPDYAVDEKFVPDELMLHEGKTTAPPLLTESDLIALMEKHGIGTDATHADHIETIKVRGYVEMGTDRRFAPRPLGLGLIEGYNLIREEMSKPFLRAALERDLQSICDGQKNPEEVKAEQIELYKNIFTQVLAERQKIEGELNTRLQGGDDPGYRGHPGGGSGGGGGSNGPRGGGHMPPPSPPPPPTSFRTQSDGDFYQHEPVPRSSMRSLSSDSNRENLMENNVSPNCGCGEPATKRKVVKSGPNQGRYFYGCTKSLGEPDRCDFFEWTTGDGNSPPAARGRGKGRRSTAKKSFSRKCGLCHKPGHTRNKCPVARRGASSKDFFDDDYDDI